MIFDVVFFTACGSSDTSEPEVTEHKMTWKTDGDKRLIDYEEESEVQENTFSIDGDKLTVNTNGDEVVYERK